MVLKLGPMERDAGTVQNHQLAVGYFRMVQGGVNPLRATRRIHNHTKGARRANGPTKRKFPVTTEDLNVIYKSIDWAHSGPATPCCAISMAWFAFAEWVNI